MPAYNDPTVLHSAECTSCQTTFRDGDVLDDNGECPECASKCDVCDLPHEVCACEDDIDEED